MATIKEIKEAFEKDNRLRITSPYRSKLGVFETVRVLEVNSNNVKIITDDKTEVVLTQTMLNKYKV